ncbi:MAG: RDD family protein [Gammaproteobacteria bacterium]|jgi:uncharacterized RDD family membrane protein YckC
MIEKTFNYPGFGRRIAAGFYDSVLLIAIVLVAVSVFTIGVEIIAGKNTSTEILKTPWIKFIYQLYLFAVAALFFIWFWSNGGQTLGMKVWKLRLVNSNNQPLSYRQASLRLFMLVITCLPMGIGFIWMLFSKNRQTLYDRWSATHMVVETN